MLTAFALLQAPVPAQERRAKPNVLVILTDDQGWGDLSLNGNTNLSTPHIDSLARDGASFERFFVCPVCSPTRAEFLTGRYHPRCGVSSTSAGGERLDLDERTIADVFRAGGYATGAFGKWHNGMQYPYHPNGRGFDEFYGFCSGHWGDYFSPPLEHNGKLVRGNGFAADDFTDRVIDFMGRHERGGKPFFAYLALNTPHSPMQVPDRFWKKFADKRLIRHHRQPEKENIGHVRAALAMCENIDWNVGRLLEKLSEMKIADDTIVVFFTDNGPNGWRFNGGMRGRKGSTDEGGVRAPLLVRWPGHILRGKSVRQIGAAIDLLPTLAGLAGLTGVDSAKRPFDGTSLAPLLLRSSESAAVARRWPDRMIFSHWRKRVSVRTQRHRLDHKGRLYDMIKDPGQRRDVSAELPKVTARLRNAVRNWRTDVLAELRPDKRPFTVGHPEFARTQRPARDAKTRGGIQRSNRFPNCSYFRNWKSIEDEITWDIEVDAKGAGEYAVEIHYACAEPDVGSTVELAFRGNSVRGRVTKPHDPPVRGGENDRVPRRESYVRDFAPMQLGRIRLKKGRGQLTLRAREIAGTEVMQFRLLMLTRVGGGR